MSAFLGPIHYWLYNKIRFQENLTDYFAGYAAEHGWAEPAPSIADDRPLEELIDSANIHGWLQNRIHEVETRYAVLITELLKENPERISVLERVAFSFGEAHSVGSNTDAADAYQQFEDTFLNGMPCDRVNVVTEKDEDFCGWDQSQELHGGYWIEADGDPAVYYTLRDKIMEGMLSESGLTLTHKGTAHYEIRNGG